MPIHCPITFPRLSEDDMRAIDYAVMGHAFATHTQLGRLCDESVYQRSWVNITHHQVTLSTIRIDRKI